MAGHDTELPTARVHRKVDGRLNRAPADFSGGVKKHVEQFTKPVAPAFHSAAHVVLGLWPLFAVVIFAAAMLWAAGFHGAP